jgi:hypothetical protein
MAAVVGLVRRDDLALLTSMFRKRGSLAAEGASRQA